MGTGTKIGLVVCLFLVVIVIVREVSDDIDGDKTDQYAKLGEAAESPSGVTEMPKNSVDRMVGNGDREATRFSGKPSPGRDVGSSRDVGMGPDSGELVPVRHETRSVFDPPAPLSVAGDGTDGSEIVPSGFEAEGSGRPEESLAANGGLIGSGGSEAVPLPPIDLAVTTPPGESASLSSDRAFPRNYVLEDGDRLWNVAEDVYGDPLAYKKILAANPELGDGSRLKPGRTIILPVVVTSAKRKASKGENAVASKGSKSPPLPARAGFRVHVLAKGDSLYRVAKKFLGSGIRWPEIERANPGIDPDTVHAGTAIYVPVK